MLPITEQVHQKIVSGFTTTASYIIILAIGSWFGYSIVCTHLVPQILTCTQRQEKKLPQRFCTDTVHEVSSFTPQGVMWDEMYVEHSETESK